MIITNNTQHASIYYSVSRKGGGVDCGTLAPGDDAVMPSFDDKPNVKVTMTISKTGDETVIEITDPGL